MGRDERLWLPLPSSGTQKQDEHKLDRLRQNWKDDAWAHSKCRRRRSTLLRSGREQARIKRLLSQILSSIADCPQVTSTVVEVNGDSSGHSSPAAEGQHTYITVASECKYYWSTVFE